MPTKLFETTFPRAMQAVSQLMPNDSLSVTMLPWTRPPTICRCPEHRAAYGPRARKEPSMRYLHTMVRITDIDQSLDFYVKKLGMKEVRRHENEAGRYTLIFLAGPEDESAGRDKKAPLLELTYNWDPEKYGEGRNFGHLAYEVDNIYDTCRKLMDAGVTINRPPRDGNMAFIRSPDNISIELLQKGSPLQPAEPWKSMQNTGKW
jgi:lactoylglutathione lyase